MIELEERRAIAKQGYRDPVFFNATFLPHIFPKPPPWIHRGLESLLTGMTDFLLDYGQVSKIVRNFAPLFQVVTLNGSDVALDDEFIDERAAERQIRIYIRRKPRLVLILPRGISKTSLAGIATPIRETVYQDVPFFCYISETGPHAKMQLDNVKRELEANERIIEVFGQLKPELRDPERWAQDMFETNTGVAMVARGRGGQIRGLNHQGNRPSKFICDDLEDKDSVETEYQRQKTRRWAYGDLLPAREKIKHASELTVMGTLLHTDSLLNTFKNDPTFSFVEFGAYDKDGEILWEEWMTPDELEEEKESASLAGELETYYLEYYSLATSSETNPFRRYKFLYAEETKIVGAPAIYCDPAISEKQTADDAVILVAGMSEKGKIIVLDGWGKRGASPREIIDEYFRLSKQFKCTGHGVESQAYQAALVHLLREEMFRKKHYFEVTPVTHSLQKARRIMGIVYPRYASGYILCAKVLPKLETQCYDYNPARKEQKDDWPDALAGVISLLDPYAASAVGDGKPLEADAYDNDQDDLRNWRWA